MGGSGDEQALRAHEVAHPIEQSIDGDGQARCLVRHAGNVEAAGGIERRHPLGLLGRQHQRAERSAHRYHGNAQREHHQRDHRHPHFVDDLRRQDAAKDAGGIANRGDLDPNVLVANPLPQAPGDMQLLFLTQVQQP
jgi:hypothetical protein